MPPNVFGTKAAKSYRFSVDFRKRGDLPNPNVRAALSRAQRENGRLWVEMTQRVAAPLIKHRYRFPERKRRGQSMLSQYRVDVSDGGRTLSLVNPTLRAKLFEEGSRPHRIRATPGANTSRRGTIVSGASMLRWRTSPGGRWTSKREVYHPGQKAQRPIGRARDALGDVFESNIRREFAREMEARGVG